MTKIALRLAQLVAISSLLNLLGELLKVVMSVDVTNASRKRIAAGFGLVLLSFILAVVWPLILVSLITEVGLYVRNRFSSTSDTTSSPKPQKRDGARAPIISAAAQNALVEVLRKFGVDEDVFMVYRNADLEIMVDTKYSNKDVAIAVGIALNEHGVRQYLIENPVTLEVVVDTVADSVTWKVQN